MTKAPVPWWKRPWVWAVAAVTALAGLGLWFLTLGGRRRGPRVTRPQGLRLPLRPALETIPVPEAADLDTDVVDDYEAEKAASPAVADTAASINSRFE